MTQLVENWISSGNAIALVITIILLEAVILGGWLRGRSYLVIMGLIPGLCLMLALRAAIFGHGVLWIGIWITASLPFHIIDLVGRIKIMGRHSDRPN
jgi:hypothetical protein